MKDLLLITPPFTQLNTPYPATPYIKGFLNTKGISAFQMDLGIEVILELFSKSGLEEVFMLADENQTIDSENSERIFSLRREYIKTIDEVILFLQGQNPALAKQICTESFLPQASRFDQIDDLEWAFGNMGDQDKAKYLATLYLEDLSDFIKECLDDNFGFSRYAERLGRSANSFDELYNYLQGEVSLIDQITLEILEQRIQEVSPKLVCFSVPFPGNLYSAFRCAQFIKDRFPSLKIAMGGGFANTELRSVSDVRVFEIFDFICLDDGERPLEELCHHVLSTTANPELKRTFQLVDNQVFYNNKCTKPDYKQAEVGTPDYSDLWLKKYISVIEIANPMHSLWSDGRWNKLTMAHGCYWGKCTFCDISLDYIKLYEPIAAKILVDRMEELIEQTGERGFHFVDEAAPPALMRALAIEILKRGLVATWWTNIRFEKNFSADLCRLLKASGCIAVSGGLEVASDRLLALIDKGVTVEQVAQVTRNFTEAGIMVHSYLMYGYPTQTIQETIDSLEMVRQMFELGILQSGFWHQFALTAHSPVGLDPDAFGVIPEIKEIGFAHNDIAFKDRTGIDHDQFSFGLKKSLFNYMHGLCFDFPLQEWFDFKIPKPTVPKNLIVKALKNDNDFMMKPTAKLLWLGSKPIISVKNTKKVLFTFHTKTDVADIEFKTNDGHWLESILPRLSPETASLSTLQELKKDYETKQENFELFWYSKPIQQMRDLGLLAV